MIYSVAFARANASVCATRRRASKPAKEALREQGVREPGGSDDENKIRRFPSILSLPAGLSAYGPKTPIRVRCSTGTGATPTPFGDTSTPGDGGLRSSAASCVRYVAGSGGNG